MGPWRPPGRQAAGGAAAAAAAAARTVYIRRRAQARENSSIWPANGRSRQWAAAILAVAVWGSPRRNVVSRKSNAFINSYTIIYIGVIRQKGGQTTVTAFDSEPRNRGAERRVGNDKLLWQMACTSSITSFYFLSPSSLCGFGDAQQRGMYDLRLTFEAQQ